MRLNDEYEHTTFSILSRDERHFLINMPAKQSTSSINVHIKILWFAIMCLYLQSMGTETHKGKTE